MQRIPGIEELKQICRKEGRPALSRYVSRSYVSVRLTRLFLICGIDGRTSKVCVAIGVSFEFSQGVGLLYPKSFA
jgi:hypothetical protein